MATSYWITISKAKISPEMWTQLKRDIKEFIDVEGEEPYLMVLKDLAASYKLEIELDGKSYYKLFSKHDVEWISEDCAETVANFLSGYVLHAVIESEEDSEHSKSAYFASQGGFMQLHAVWVNPQEITDGEINSYADVF